MQTRNKNKELSRHVFHASMTNAAAICRIYLAEQQSNSSSLLCWNRSDYYQLFSVDDPILTTIVWPTVKSKLLIVFQFKSKHPPFKIVGSKIRFNRELLFKATIHLCDSLITEQVQYAFSGSSFLESALSDTRLLNFSLLFSAAWKIKRASFKVLLLLPHDGALASVCLVWAGKRFQGQGT